MKAVCVIPARGGSRRVPGKNKRLFHGKPIIQYSIEAALQARGDPKFSRIIVSTDDGDIARIASDLSVEVHWRRPEDATDSVGTQQVVRSVIEQCRISPTDFELCCAIYATAPLMSLNDLMEGLFTVTRPEFNYAMSVGTDPLCDAGQFYWGATRAFACSVPLLTPFTAMIPISAERVCDINTPEDWARAESMYDALRRATP